MSFAGIDPDDVDRVVEHIGKRSDGWIAAVEDRHASRVEGA